MRLLVVSFLYTNIGNGERKKGNEQRDYPPHKERDRKSGQHRLKEPRCRSFAFDQRSVEPRSFFTSLAYSHSLCYPLHKEQRTVISIWDNVRLKHTGINFVSEAPN